MSIYHLRKDNKKVPQTYLYKGVRVQVSKDPIMKTEGGEAGVGELVVRPWGR